MTILIDMDDVLEDLVSGWVYYINDRFGTHVRPQDVKDWNMALAFPDLTPEQVYSAVTDDKLWSYVKPFDQAVTYTKRLIDDGHTLYVVTASHYKTLSTKMETVLFRYFPHIGWDRVIVTENKHLIKGDVLIDDGPHNLSGGDYRKILFDANHNHGFDEKSIGAVRAYGWQDVYRIINELFSEDAKRSHNKT